MEISSSVQTILRAPDAPVQKKVDSASPSLCSRIFSAVKHALATFVYFVTFCQVDLREKTALFANQPGFHALTSLPKKTSDLENEVFKAITSLKKDNGESVFNKGVLETENFKNVFGAVSKEFATMLTAAFNSKELNPVEWKITVHTKEGNDALTLTLYARESSDVKKLPELTANAENKDALVVSPKWEKTTVALEQDDAKKKANPIKCYARTIDLYVEKMPIAIDIKSKKEIEEQLVKGCGLAGFDAAVPQADIKVLWDFLAGLRMEPQFNGLDFIVEGRSAIDGTQEYPRGFSPALLIRIKSETVITAEQSKAVNLYAREHFRQDLFSESIHVYNNNGNFVQAFRDAGHLKYLGVTLTHPRLQPAPFAAEE